MMQSILACVVTTLGAISMLFALISLGAGLHETATIPPEMYKDPALGYPFAIFFAAVGSALLGMGHVVRMMGKD